jgi:hypothetical protein
MARRALPALLLAAAALADAAGAHLLANYALLAAVPALAAAALAAFGDTLEDGRGGGRALQAGLWVAALVTTTFAAGERAPLVDEGAVPRLAVYALAAALVALALEAMVGLYAVTALRGRPRRPLRA